MFNQNQSLLQKNYDLHLLRAQNKAIKIEARQQREDNKTLCKYLDSITNSVLRKAFKNEQMKFFAKRAQEEQSQGRGASSSGFS